MNAWHRFGVALMLGAIFAGPSLLTWGVFMFGAAALIFGEPADPGRALATPPPGDQA